MDTESRSEELSQNIEYQETAEDTSLPAEGIPTGLNYVNIFKNYYRTVKKTFSQYLREKMKKQFNNIIFLTVDLTDYVKSDKIKFSPLDFIEEFRQQYPVNNIRLMVPIINLDEDFKPAKKISVQVGNHFHNLKKTGIEFNYFFQNSVHECIIYKFENTDSNIQIYGLYSPVFSYLQDDLSIKRFENLVPFLRAARTAVRNLKRDDFPVDIIHSDKLPLFMGTEFEPIIQFMPKVFMTVDDFTYEDFNKQEPFWALINLADKNAIKKLLSDVYVKKCIFELFENHPAIETIKIEECLRLIFKNYTNFKFYANEENNNAQNIIFRHLNSRVKKLFPNFMSGENTYFYPTLLSLKKADFWAVFSKTYYKSLSGEAVAPEAITKQIAKSSEKSSCIDLGFDSKLYSSEDKNSVHLPFDSQNFKENKAKNKSFLLKEFSSERVNTGFVSPSLFKTEDIKIYGHLDSFYEAPLFFANIDSDIFSAGVDIMFNTILKLFELNKNFQIIISMPKGMQSPFIKERIEFLENNSLCDGRWVFLDTPVNIEQFYASSDMILITDRVNNILPKHLIAMKYGCVPIASKTGFINDTLIDILDNIKCGCGFKTHDSLLKETSNSMVYYDTLMKALNIFNNNPSSWNIIVKNCMNTDCNWNFEKLEKYNDIYKEILY